MDKIVTIFGGSGFLGRHVVRHFTRQGWQVRVAGRHPSKARYLQPLGDVGQIMPIRGDLQDDELVAAAVDGAEVVINLCGILFERGRQSFEAVHHLGAERVAKAAASAGARSLVQISAIGADSASLSEYARSKAAGELAVQAAFPNAVILRPSIVFGPDDDFFNRFAAMARLSPFLPLIGGGQTRFQPVYVGDVAQAIYQAAGDSTCFGRIYELGGPQVFTFAELLALMLRHIRRRRLLLPIPFWLAEIQARVLELLPVPLLTRDQVQLLRYDNLASAAYPGLEELGVQPTAVEVVLPRYLDRYRPGGRYTAHLPT